MTSNSGNAERIAKALDPKATRLSDGSWSCCCPAHDDHSPSLSLDWKDGKLVWHCWTGCSQADVQAELKRRGLLGKPNGSTYEHKPKAKANQGGDWRPILPVPEGSAEPGFTHHELGKPTTVWTYVGTSGETLLHVARFDPAGERKQILPFVWGTLSGRTGWHWKNLPDDRPLYGLDRLAARPDAPVLIVEGEKAADAAAALLPDYVVMTWQGGSNATGKALWASLAGRKVTIWPDADEAGHKAAKAVADALRGIAASVRTVQLPEGLPDKWDLADPIPEGIDVDLLLGEAKEPEPPLRIIRPSDWQGKPVPERKWLVKGWIPDGHVTAFYGNGGTGKSLLAQQLLTAGAIGADWLGLETKPCRMIGFFCEDHEDELHRRQEAINSMFGCDYSDLENMQLVSRVHLENLLMDFTKDGTGTATELHKHLIRWAKDFGAEAVVVDTAADTFGGNENARTEVRLFIQKCLGEIAREINGSVILCAHPSVAGMKTGTGGSTGWSNSVRSRLHLYYPDAQDEAEPDRNARILELPKANYGSTGENVRLRYVDGTLRPDVRVDATSTGNLGSMERLRAEAVFLELLAKATSEGRWLSASPQAAGFAPKQMARMADRQGFDKRDLQQAMERLFAQGRITTEEYNRQGSRKIVACEPGEAKPEGNPYDFHEAA